MPAWLPAQASAAARVAWLPGNCCVWLAALCSGAAQRRRGWLGCQLLRTWLPNSLAALCCILRCLLAQHSQFALLFYLLPASLITFPPLFLVLCSDAAHDYDLDWGQLVRGRTATQVRLYRRTCTISVHTLRLALKLSALLMAWPSYSGGRNIAALKRPVRVFASASALQTRRRWRLMLKVVPDHRDLEFREAVLQLVQKYTPQLLDRRRQSLETNGGGQEAAEQGIE